MITSRFQASFRTVVTILRDGGVDRYGDNLPESEHQVPDCLIGPASTKDLVDFDQSPTEAATLYGPVGMDIRPTDRVRVPGTHPMAGVYRVNGRPGRWPLGTAVPLLWVHDL